MKISATCAVLFAAASTAAIAKEDPYVEGEVLVTFRQDVPLETARTRLARKSLGLTENYDRLSARQRRVCGMIREKRRTTADLIAELKTDPDIETAEPNYLRRISFIRPDDPHFPKLWGLENTGLTVNGTASTSGADTRFMQAWNLSRTTSSTEIVVGVIDTGVDITHPDLAANIWTNPGEISGNGIDDDANGRIDDVHGYDFASGTATITDSGDHGTHVAGTIAATGKNGLGVIGLQFKAKVIPMKVSNDGLNMSASAVIAACNYAVALKQKGINIVALNASYGGGSFSTSEQNALAALRDNGIVFCAAAGNDTQDNDSTPDYPSGYALANIISVASITQTNGISSFSNYGATTVDLGAPGSNIYSTAPVSDFGRSSSITIGSTTYEATELEFSGTTSTAGLTRTIHHCGTGESSAAFPAAVSGNIALIQRGNNTFAEKVTFARNAGAVAVILYNNVVDTGGWTLGTAGTWIPVLQVTQATGNAILASLPATGTLVNAPNPTLAYQFLSGTSMAAPQVTAAVAFAALNFPAETMAQRISRILTRTTAVPALAGKTVTGGRLDILKMIDTDDDGLPDWWETEHFNTLAHTAPEDPDGDGFTNLVEFRSGASPVSSASHLAFDSIQPSGADFLLSLPTVSERRYQIDWSDDLEPPWTPLGGTITGTGSPIQLTDPGALTTSPRRFYRLHLLED